MHTLYILYDARCGICTSVKDWLVRQPSYVALRLVAQDSAEARERFPMFAPDNLTSDNLTSDNLASDKQELVVVADTGEVWTRDRAWIMCLWALCEFREWAVRLRSPALLPLARQAFVAFSSNRAALSRLFGLRTEAELRRTLGEIQVPPCQI